MQRSRKFIILHGRETFGPAPNEVVPTGSGQPVEVVWRRRRRRRQRKGLERQNGCRQQTGLHLQHHARWEADLLQLQQWSAMQEQVWTRARMSALFARASPDTVSQRERQGVRGSGNGAKELTVTGGWSAGKSHSKSLVFVRWPKLACRCA